MRRRIGDKQYRTGFAVLVVQNRGENRKENNDDENKEIFRRRTS